MSDHGDVHEIVEIDFEVGHSSIIRPEPTTSHNPPRTHDWKIFLRSADIHGDLSCLIQRCIFHLHPEYPNHKRELKTSPFALQETGYAGFRLPIEIFFQTKKEPRKYRIEYDLDLHRNIGGHPYRQKESFLQKYRCTFYDPDPEFRQKILAAGGKILDTGPMGSNNIDLDESSRDEEIVVRHSPQQKRAASPISIANGILPKKVKLEQPTNSIKKKQVQSVVKNESTNKTIVKTKKPKLVPHKSSSLLEEKGTKNLPIKESNQTTNISQHIENLSSSKSRPSTKLIKSQSTNDIKASISSTTTNTKKKETISPPTKPKSTTNSQNVIKKPVNKIPPKTLVKSESTLNLTSSNTSIKQESSSQPASTVASSSNTNSSVSINNLKKIPKKPPPPKVEEKRSHSVKPSSSSSSNRNSTISKDSPKQKIKSNSKQPRPSLSVNNNSSQNTDRPKKTKIVKDPPPQSRVDVPVLSSPSIATHVPQTEDNHVQTPMEIDRHDDIDELQLSEESNSPREQILIQPTMIPPNRISYSDQSESNDSDLSMDDDLDEQDLPTSLTNDDLRYKLIYIYKRFQSNLLHDLYIFVRFFKRHQLIDLSALSMTKSTNDMFTYDLFSLSPDHIGELANDLGYHPINSTK